MNFKLILMCAAFAVGFTAEVVPMTAVAAPAVVEVPTGTLYADKAAGWACFLPANTMDTTDQKSGGGGVGLAGYVELNAKGGRAKEINVRTDIPSGEMAELAKTFALCLLSHEKSMPYKARVAATMAYIEALSGDELKSAREKNKELERDKKNLIDKLWVVGQADEAKGEKLATIESEHAQEIAKMKADHEAEKKSLMDIVEAQAVVIEAFQELARQSQASEQRLSSRLVTEVPIQ